jgi:hypothetical protein
VDNRETIDKLKIRRLRSGSNRLEREKKTLKKAKKRRIGYSSIKRDKLDSTVIPK